LDVNRQIAYAAPQRVPTLHSPYGKNIYAWYKQSMVRIVSKLDRIIHAFTVYCLVLYI